MRWVEKKLIDGLKWNIYQRLSILCKLPNLHTERSWRNFPNCMESYWNWKRIFDLRNLCESNPCKRDCNPSFGNALQCQPQRKDYEKYEIFKNFWGSELVIFTSPPLTGYFEAICMQNSSPVLKTFNLSGHFR